MSFLFPAFFVGVLAVAIPIVLHLMRREAAPRVAFSDIRFLRRAPVMQFHRRRLRELLLLALRVGALLFLALAFARPFVDDSDVLGRPVTVVVLDRSYSMGAPGTFERARAAAVESITDAPAGHAVALVSFDHGADIVQEPTTDRTAVAASVDGLVAGDGGTRFGLAVSTAVDLIGSRDGRVVVVTDLQAAGWADEGTVAVPSAVRVETNRVVTETQNLGIVGVHLGATSVSAVVVNDGPERSTTVTAAVDDEVVWSRTLVASSGTSEVSLDFIAPPAGVLEVSLVDPDGYPADDRRFTLLDPPEPMSLAIVTSGDSDDPAFFLERAFGAGQAGAHFDVTSLPATDVVSRLPGEFDALIVVGTTGLDRQGRERIARFVSRGGGLLVVAGPSLDAALVSDLLGDDVTLGLQNEVIGSGATFSVTDGRHPIFQALGAIVGTLPQIRVERFLRVTESGGMRVLARFDDGAAALVEYPVPDGRALVFASDFNNEWNDFPRRPMFVPFVHETLRYLVGTRDERRELTLDEVPVGMVAALGPAPLPTSGRRVVVNVDPVESDSSSLTPAAFASRVMTLQPDVAANNVPAAETDAAALEAAQGYWWYALVVVGLLLVGEAWVGRRTV